ncbi:MAG: NADP-dependent 3-hydroxy acid dehydrogenase YdfG [Actinomycetota bacterium]|jgi:short-subunit dehydrogenase
MNFKGKTAVITGASSGIGLGYAYALAARGANLVLVARNKPQLEKLAEDIKAGFDVRIDVVALDLSKVTSGQELLDALKNLNISADVLINNAGFGTNQRVSSEDRTKIQQEILLNVVTLVDLTAAVLPQMLAKDFGVIVNIGSTASFQPVPGMAVYAATKAFVRSFTSALWGEVKDTNVRVLTVNPGATATEFFNIAEAKPAGKLAPVSEVINATFKALDAKNSSPSIVVGGQNALMAHFTRLVPVKAVINIAAKLFLH